MGTHPSTQGSVCLYTCSPGALSSRRAHGSPVLGSTGHPAPLAALCLPAQGGKGGGSCQEPSRSQGLQRTSNANGEGGRLEWWLGKRIMALSVYPTLSTAPLHWLTLRWSCVTVSRPSTGTKCRTSILTKDCEWRLPQEPSRPSALLPPPIRRPLSRVRGTGQHSLAQICSPTQHLLCSLLPLSNQDLTLYVQLAALGLVQSHPYLLLAMSQPSHVPPALRDTCTSCAFL